jgi:hypothetical protein
MEPPCAATVAGEVKLVPVMVTLTVVPGEALLGLIETSVGLAGGGLTVNDCAPLVPAAVLTVTLRAPVAALEAMVNVAVMVVALTTVIAEAVTPVPLIAMVAPEAKLVPVSVTPTAEPGDPLPDAMEVSVGFAGAAFTVND